MDPEASGWLSEKRQKLDTGADVEMLSRTAVEANKRSELQEDGTASRGTLDPVMKTMQLWLTKIKTCSLVICLRVVIIIHRHSQERV